MREVRHKEQEESSIKDYIIPDKVFDQLQSKLKEIKVCNWQKELVGCKIVGIEPITDGVGETERAVGMILYIEDTNGRKRLVESSTSDEYFQEFTQHEFTLYQAMIPHDVTSNSQKGAFL